MNRTPHRTAARWLALAVLILGWATFAFPVRSAGGRTKEALKFAAEMASIGNWREARFRWESLARELPRNSRVQNNLAVAAEALGEPETARESYDRAIQLSGNDERIANNHRRFERFWRHALEEKSDEGSIAAAVSSEQMPENPDGKGKAIKVTVSLPVPARLELEDEKTLLVASFIAADSSLLDTNRELVRYLRAEFRKGSSLEILPVSPPPAVPEQSLEDLIANREFWMHLGREYDADLIVSGVMLYDRRDISGFREVDVVSRMTGQKVRQTQFVEEEQFRHEIDLIFMDGATGELRFRDRLQRAAVYRGAQNDPITAFHDLAESMSADILAIVRPRTREDIRYVFKN